jgi:hypothetical protein
MLMGAAMRPDLGDDERPAGPQIVQSAPRHAAGPFEDDDDAGVALAAHAGKKIPDYVLGVDWKKATQAPAAAAAPREVAEPVAHYYERPPMDIPEPQVKAESVTRATYAQAAPQPERPAQIDADAPPETTGDTAPVR